MIFTRERVGTKKKDCLAGPSFEALATPPDCVLAFNFAVRRKLAIENPAAQSAKATVINDVPPAILTVEQATRLLAAADAQIVPYLAVGLFVGLRRAELERLDWAQVNFERGFIEVTAKNAKSRQRRIVTMQPNLSSWLLPHRKLSSNVAPELGFRELFEAARKAAGIEPWPRNALRHSFASYHLAHFNNAARTSLELGHRSSGMLFAHYRELVMPGEAARYWAIVPQPQADVVVPFAG
jgi:integrase